MLRGRLRVYIVVQQACQIAESCSETGGIRTMCSLLDHQCAARASFYPQAISYSPGLSLQTGNGAPQLTGKTALPSALYPLVLDMSEVSNLQFPQNTSISAHGQSLFGAVKLI